MNAKPGGKQPCMRDTIWCGRPQAMVDRYGVLKGMKKVLEERGISTTTLVADDTREILSNHHDLATEKTIMENSFGIRGYTGVVLPKFHCELNPIERVWGKPRYRQELTQILQLYGYAQSLAQLWTKCPQT